MIAIFTTCLSEYMIIRLGPICPKSSLENFYAFTGSQVCAAVQCVSWSIHLWIYSSTVYNYIFTTTQKPTTLHIHFLCDTEHKTLPQKIQVSPDIRAHACDSSECLTFSCSVCTVQTSALCCVFLRLAIQRIAHQVN